MPRENSFTDSEGRSLTPDLEDEEDFEVQPRPSISSPPIIAPTYATSPAGPFAGEVASPPTSPFSNEARAHGVKSPAHQAKPTAKDKFRAVVRKVISMHRGASYMVGGLSERVGAEPGVDPRRASADMQYGHIVKECAIEITDYSSVRSNVRKMNNAQFIDLMHGEEKRPAWVRVRWINIGGVSWDVIKALSLKFSPFIFFKTFVLFS